MRLRWRPPLVAFALAFLLTLPPPTCGGCSRHGIDALARRGLVFSDVDGLCAFDSAGVAKSGCRGVARCRRGLCARKKMLAPIAARLLGFFSTTARATDLTCEGDEWRLQTVEFSCVAGCELQIENATLVGDVASFAVSSGALVCSRCVRPSIDGRRRHNILAGRRRAADKMQIG